MKTSKFLHVIGILIENEPGALARVVGLFAQRGYNIESLTVATTEDATLSRLTLTTYGSDRQIEQISKQLNRLICVYRVLEISTGEYLAREIMLVKVQFHNAHRQADIHRLTEIFGGKIVDVTAKTYVLELVGKGKKMDAFLQALEGVTVLEVVRSGVCAVARGDLAMS